MIKSIGAKMLGVHSLVLVMKNGIWKGIGQLQYAKYIKIFLTAIALLSF